MEKITIKLFVVVIVLQCLLHRKLQVITQEKDYKQRTQNTNKPISLSFFSEMQVFPNVIWRLWSSFNINFLSKNLKFSFIHDSLCFSNVFVIFKSHKNTAYSCVILLFLKKIYVMFNWKNLCGISISNSLSSISQQLYHHIVIKD